MYKVRDNEGLAAALIRAGIKKSAVCKAVSITSYEYERIVKNRITTQAA
ncbi:MAG: hypothetical protein OCD01_02045 [Fibrobacterales bacterium]